MGRAVPVSLAIVVLTALANAADTGEQVRNIVNRISEEAEVFSGISRGVLAEETLQQTTLKPKPRFRPRAAPDEFLRREIVSEYGYSSFQDSPGALHEFRQVVSVDGRHVLASEKARRSLTLGVTSTDDQVKKRILKDFEKYGLAGAVTDFGQVILLFGKRRVSNYEFELLGEGRLGADTALVLSYKQTGGPEALTIFEGRSAIREKMKGQVWVRKSDYLPLRVTLTAARAEHGVTVTTLATVDYAMTAHGAIMPASVLHRETAAGHLLTENIFRYGPFRKFSADTEIKFTGIP